MYVAIVKALVDTTGPDITRNNIDMPAGSRHMVSMLDIKYFLAHPDAFLIEDSNYDLFSPLLTQIDSNGNSIANIIPRTGTLASLMTLAGGAGEIAVATDVNALVKFNGVAGQAVAFYRGIETGRTTIQSIAGQTAGAANAWQAAIFSGGQIIEDTLGAADLANNQIVIPPTVDHYEVNWWIEFVESGTPTGSTRQGRGMYLSGATPYPFPNTTSLSPVLIVGNMLGLMSRSTKQTAITNYRLQYYHDSTVVPTYTAILQVIMYGK